MNNPEEEKNNSSNDVQGANQSGNMYSFNHDQQNNQNLEAGAIRRSLGEGNPNAISNYQINNNINQNDQIIDPNTLTIQVDQSPPLYWMFFLIFGIIQIIFIIFIANFYEWDNLNKPSTIGNEDNTEAKEQLEKNFKTFQDINIMIILGFGFLRAFLKHYSWSSIAITFIGGILSFEFGLFSIICWASIMRRNWYPGVINFRYFLDANYCAAAIIISMGALFGKLSFPQYFVMILCETIFSTLNYVLNRQKLKIIDTGGALTVHLFGAIYGAIFTLISFSSKSERDRIRVSPHFGKNYNSNIFGLFGTLISITYWPSFNTGLVKGNQKYRGIINTYLSIGGSIIGTFIISSVCNKRKFKIEDILNSSFAGGIIIAGCCTIIREFWSCIILGFFAGGLSSFLFFILNNKLIEIGYHDTSGILFYHGIPGFLGGIISTIFVGNLKNWSDCKEEDYLKYIDNFIDINFNFTDFYLNTTRSYSQRAGIQFGSIFITISIAAVSGLFSGFLIKFCNCEIAIRYFNDSEIFDDSDNEPFPWDDEKVLIKLNYKSRKNNRRIITG